MVTPKIDPGSAQCTGFVAVLIKRCGAGDAAALGTLFDMFVDVVRVRVAGRSSEDTVDEAVCAAFAQIWERSPSFRPGPQNGVDWVLHQVTESSDRRRLTMAQEH